MNMQWTSIVFVVYFLSTDLPLHAQLKFQTDSTKLVAVTANQALRKQPFQINQSDVWFSKDKADHLMVSAMLCAGTIYWAKQENGWSDNKSRIAGVSIPLVIGLLKEIWDGYQPNHTASWNDVFADVAGIGVGYIMFNE